MIIVKMTSDEIYRTIPQEAIDNNVYRIYSYKDVFPAKNRRRVKRFIPYLGVWDEYFNGVEFRNYADGEGCPCRTSATFWVVTD